MTPIDLDKQLELIKTHYPEFHYNLWSDWAPRIREMRLQSGMAKEDVCKKLKISEEQLWAVECGGIEADMVIYFKLCLLYSGIYDKKELLLNCETEE